MNTVAKKTVSKQVQEAWDKICERGAREGKTEKKAEALCINLAFGKPP